MLNVFISGLKKSIVTKYKCMIMNDHGEDYISSNNILNNISTSKKIVT